ncbi:hypothetical protein CYMTET_40272 [Cymbomonas tetramitiformis]|uniref:Uncharacterized protein n=1 Tax=Cymbomonas tetramitiformis TaxID=36881 RepID=A0AAE0CAL0_9CHLO|nr:hypothetical protein CYMTET_40272 [Cymbomonas tetramitiformis]
MNTSFCIVTFLTQNLLSAGGWGTPAVDINRRYAQKHGYQFFLETEPLQPIGAPINWSPVFAALKAESAYAGRC